MSGDAVLKGRDAQLRFARTETGTISLRLEAFGIYFEQPAPCAVEVVDGTGEAVLLSGGYSKVVTRSSGMRAAGTLLSSNGTQFRFQDDYLRDSDGFQLTRQVTVVAPAMRDVGFSSRFGLAAGKPWRVRDCEVLMPGAWYRDNRTVPPGAFGANPDAAVLMYREDRLGLPLVALRDKQNGISLVLERVGGNPTTFAGEQGRARIIDARLQFGAVGLLQTGPLTAAFTFPGTEDERTTSNAPAGPRFAPRSHPVQVGVPHTYTLHFAIRQTANFALLVETTLKPAINRARPPLLRADLSRVYRASIDLLNAVTQSHNGFVGVPFQVVVPSGDVKDTSSQMGFVGMALPSAALLLRDGLETGNTGAVERATAVLDFWVQKSPEPSGVPKNWCDFPAPNKVTWRGYPTHLRVASDGMRGVLQAWNTARRFALDKPEWLAYARAFGDFLVKQQNADGSWFGSWNFDGTPHDRYTNASVHPVAFLVDLYCATNNTDYRKAALQAGNFCWQTIHLPYSYVGGTPDNPNVTDKEAGVLATDGFMALFDATGDRKWLLAARQAALFCETWVYWRNIPMPADNPGQVFPQGRSTVGLSLIATGHSGTDNFMAFAPFLWYRLYLATGDAHFLQTARLLLHDTKQIIDWDGSLGYKYPGLMPEAMGLAMNRGKGIAGWLPWLTVVTADPLVKLRDTFGTWDIDAIERLPLTKRRDRNATFAATRGFAAPNKPH